MFVCRNPVRSLLSILCVFCVSVGQAGVAVPVEPLRIAIAYAPKTLDPALASDAAGARLIQLTNPALLAYNDKYHPVPLVASECVQPAPTQVVCTLPAGHTFTNGAPLNAPALQKWFISLQSIPRSPAADALKNVSITTPAPLQLAFRLPSPTLTFLNKLTEIPLADPAAPPGPMAARPGLGPYAVAAADALGNVTLTRQRSRNDVPAGLSFLFVQDPSTRILKLKKQEVDIIQNDVPPELFTYGLKQHWPAIVAPSASYSYLGYNFENRYLKVPAVREAIAHIVNRPAIRQYLLGVQASPATTLLPPTHPLAWHAPEEEPDAYTAEDLLDSAGFFRGPPVNGHDSRFELTLTLSTDPLSQRLAQVLQQQFAGAGITLRLQPTEWAAFYDAIRKGRYDLMLASWTGEQAPSFLYNAFHGSQVPPNGLNRGHVNDPALNTTLESVQNASTPETLAQATLRAQQQLATLRPYLPLYRRHHVLLMHPSVTGCKLDTAGSYRGLLFCRKQ